MQTEGIGEEAVRGRNASTSHEMQNVLTFKIYE